MPGFKYGQVWKCYKFARDMIGNHNENMIMKRETWEIFRDDFRGKLGEVGLWNELKEMYPNADIPEPDFSVSPKGQWDILDLRVDDIIISVKSIKSNADFFMIETKRFDENGNFRYRNNDGSPIKIDLHVLVKVGISPEMDENDMGYSSTKEIWDNKRIFYKVMGGITHDNFWRLKHIAHRGIKCNKDNLNKACLNLEVETGNIKTDPKTEVLQQDNYIMSDKSLPNVGYVLESIKQDKIFKTLFADIFNSI